MSRELLKQMTFNKERLEDVVMSLETRVAVESETYKYRDYVKNLKVYIGQLGAAILGYEEEVKSEEEWQVFMNFQNEDEQIR